MKSLRETLASHPSFSSKRKKRKKKFDWSTYKRIKPEYLNDALGAFVFGLNGLLTDGRFFNSGDADTVTEAVEQGVEVTVGERKFKLIDTGSRDIQSYPFLFQEIK